MKVSELIEHLSQLPPDAKVIISKDSEGNEYSPLASLWSGGHAPEEGCPWFSQVGFLELTEELIEDGYTEEDILEDGEPAVILCPTC